MPHTTTDPIGGHGPISPNRIVLHTTEGILHARDLSPFFRRNGNADVHMAIDATPDAVHIVASNEKAWHVAAYNGTSLGIEQCGFARWTEHDWVKGFNLGLLRVAAALSNWSSAHPNIKLKHAVNGGVCFHRDLGAAGGGHWDPGYHYPMRYVLYLARLHYYRKRGWNKTRPVRTAAYKAYCYAMQRKHGLKPRTVL